MKQAMIRRAGASDAPVVARLVDALLIELSGSPSGIEERLATARKLLAERDRIFGFLAIGAAGAAKLLIDTTVALGRERFWSRVEVGAPHQPIWERSLKFYLRNRFVEVGPRLQLML